MSEIIQQFHFVRPEWFWALLPAAALVLLLWAMHKNGNQWSKIVAPQFLPFLLDNTQIQQKKWPLLGLLLLWLASVTALAGPAWEKIPQPVEKAMSPLVIAWDLSPSMFAEDFEPSRLMRSRLKITDLLKSRDEGQTALIAYSGEAYTVTPLTDDTQTIITLLPALSPTTLPSVGSNPEMAIDQAQQLLKDAGAGRGDILFVTDSIDPSAFDHLQQQMRHSPHTLTIWGVGSKDGAPIPLPDGGFAKDGSGDIVVARLNESALQGLATRVDGYYVPMTNADSDIGTLNQLMTRNPRDTQTSHRMFDQWFEHGQYLALVLLPLIALIFRRGWFFCLALVLPASLFSPTANALSWQDLWLTQDQQAERELRQGDPDAATQFSTPRRRGAALYQQQQFDEAAQAFAQSSDAVDAYNRGTALTQEGQYEGAIEAFDEALAARPNFKEAKENRAIAEQLAALEQQQEGSESDQQSQPGDSGEQEEGESQQNDGEQGQDGQQSDGAQDGKQDSSDEGGTPSENTDTPPDDSSEAEGTDLAKEDSPELDDNPFSEAQAEQDSESNEQNQAGQLREEQDGDGTEEQELANVVEPTQAPQTEEEQMLNQWLRRVPDDPSGLLRNKFRHQYLQRKQSLEQVPHSTKQAEERW